MKHVKGLKVFGCLGAIGLWGLTKGCQHAVEESHVLRDHPILMVVIVVAVVSAAIWAWLSATKRRRSLAAIAKSIPGATFVKGQLQGVALRFPGLPFFEQGRGASASNRIRVKANGCQCEIMDYTYQTGVGLATRSHTSSIIVADLPADLPHLCMVWPESFADKALNAAGLSDIQFESQEFNRAFSVNATDKKFAYDVVNARMMEWLLAHPDVSFQLKGRFVALRISKKKLAPERWLELPRLVTELQSHLPDYLLQKHPIRQTTQQRKSLRPLRWPR